MPASHAHAPLQGGGKHWLLAGQGVDFKKCPTWQSAGIQRATIPSPSQDALCKARSPGRHPGLLSPLMQTGLRHIRCKCDGNAMGQQDRPQQDSVCFGGSCAQRPARATGCALHKAMSAHYLRVLDSDPDVRACSAANRQFQRARREPYRHAIQHAGSHAGVQQLAVNGD